MGEMAVRRGYHGCALDAQQLVGAAQGTSLSGRMDKEDRESTALVVLVLIDTLRGVFRSLSHITHAGRVLTDVALEGERVFFFTDLTNVIAREV